MMYEKILVALDRSPMAEKVFHDSLTLAKKTESNLILLHVLSIDAEDSPLSFAPMSMSYNPETLEQYHQEWNKFSEECLEMLKYMQKQAQQEGVETKIIQENGRAGKVICQKATELAVDLIVMGRRGHSLINEMVMGSVSSYVLHHANGSVLIVQ
jgi:nucleotide-binding universal stress UspA family protein